MICDECGNEFEIDESRIATHIGTLDTDGYDLDADHVPFSREAEGGHFHSNHPKQKHGQNMKRFKVKTLTKQRMIAAIGKSEEEELENVTALSTYTVEAPNIDLAEAKLIKNLHEFTPDSPVEYPMLTEETGVHTEDLWVIDILENSKPFEMTTTLIEEDKEKELYVVEYGYCTEAGRFYSPIFITKTPEIVEELNRKKEDFLKIRQGQWEDLRSGKNRDYLEPVETLLKKTFGKYGALITEPDTDTEFIASPLPIM